MNDRSIRNIRRAAVFAAVIGASAGLAAGSVADDYLEGKVVSIRIPWEFKDGKIDWHFNPTTLEGHGPVNHEWTWQLNRHSEWNALVWQYSQTKDPKYAAGFARILESWLDQTNDGIPPEERRQYNRPYSAFRTIEEGCRLDGPWVRAWHAFKDAPEFTGALKARFKKSIRAQMMHLMHHYTDRNWLLIELNGAHNVACNFPEFPESAECRREAARIVADDLLKQVLPDGFHYELTPGYHGTIVDCGLPIWERSKKFGFVGDLPENYLDFFRRGADAVLALMTPSFRMPCFNDTASPCGLPGVLAASKLFPDRQDFRWAITHGKEGTPPAGETASRLMPYSGWAAMRTGWDREALYVAFDFGPLSMGHEHQDKLGFTMWKGDEELVFDDGGGQYTSGDPLRTYAVSGYDHNVLLVDGLAQYRRTPLKYDSPVNPDWKTTEKYDYAAAVYDQGFGPQQLKLARHRREIALDKVNGLVKLVDTVDSADGAEHEYALLFQLDTLKTEISEDGRRLTAHYGRKYDLVIETEEGASISTVSGQKEPRYFGWFVGRGGTKPHPATTAFVKAPKCRGMRFVTVLRPVAAGK